MSHIFKPSSSTLMLHLIKRFKQAFFTPDAFVAIVLNALRLFLPTACWKKEQKVIKSVNNFLIWQLNNQNFHVSYINMLIFPYNKGWLRTFGLQQKTWIFVIGSLALTTIIVQMAMIDEQGVWLKYLLTANLAYIKHKRGTMPCHGLFIPFHWANNDMGLVECSEIN